MLRVLFSDATITVAPSGNFSDPSSWVVLVREIGVGGFFAIFGALFLGFFAWKFGLAVFGEKGWLSKFYDDWKEGIQQQTQNTNSIADTMKTHLEACNKFHAPAGQACVLDIRQAGHEFAEIAREAFPDKPKIGERADKIHDILRGTTSASSNL